jgi:hypothetical protein
MPRKADFIFDVNIRIPEAFTLDSIVRSPRTFKPKDVASACQNNHLVLKHGQPPPMVVSLATYMMTDFFAMAHGTGLYNRQRHLWESLSQVNSIHVQQLSSGVFHKSQLPIFDFSFQDYKGKPLLYVLLVSSVPDKQKATSLLKAFIGRAHGKSSLTGSIACFPAPMPTDVLEAVRNQTNTTDAIARYEAVFPALRVPFDLLEMDQANLMQLSQEGLDSGELRTVFRLVHPDLKSKAEITEPPRVMRKVMPKPKHERDADLESQSEHETASAVESAASDTQPEETT